MVALPEAFDPAAVALDESDLTQESIPSSVVSLSPFRAAFESYVEAGYSVIPIWPGDKKPGKFDGAEWRDFPNWPSFAERQRTTPGVLQHWKGYPDAGVGIILGTKVGDHQVIALDFDTDNADELDALQSSIPPSPMRKRGARGYTAFYRAGTDVKTKRYAAPAPTQDKPDARRIVLEILTGNAPKQTVMPPSVHPLGGCYGWYAGGRLVAAGAIPILEDHHFERLEDTLAHLGCSESAGRACPVAANDHRTHDGSGTDYFRDINEAALANLDAWVPGLGLLKTEKKGSRWEAVAEWRPSSKLRPLHERNPNLSFHPTGIKDMGTDERYTACNVVLAAKGWGDDSERAFAWLRERLGIKDDVGFLDDITVSSPKLAEADDGSLYDSATGEIIVEAEGLRERQDDSDRETDSFDELPERLTHPEGLLGEVTQWIVDTARTPNRVLALGPAIVTLGTLAGRRDAGPTMSGTALYVLNLAPSGAGKQHGLDQVQRLIRAAGQPHLLGTSEFMSATSVISLLKREKLTINPMDEFGSLLKRINARNAGAHDRAISKMLRQVWGTPFTAMATPEWANQAREWICSPAMSILGVSTPREFYGALTDGDVENGTLNRFLVLPTNKKVPQVDPPVDPFNVPEDLAESLKLLFEARDRPMVQGDGPVDPKKIPWGDGAKTVHDAFKKEIECIRNSDGDDSDFYARTTETAVRLATICAVGRNLECPEVSVADMEWGRDVALWASKKLARDTEKYASDSPAGALWGKITERLERAGGRMPYEELRGKFKIGTKEWGDALKAMEDAGLIEVKSVIRKDGKAGRPRRFIRLLQQ